MHSRCYCAPLNKQLHYPHYRRIRGGMAALGRSFATDSRRNTELTAASISTALVRQAVNTRGTDREIVAVYGAARYRGKTRANETSPTSDDVAVLAGSEEERMEPIRLVCRRSEEVASFKARSHILPMDGLEHGLISPGLVALAIARAEYRGNAISRRARRNTSDGRLERTAGRNERGEERERREGQERQRETERDRETERERGGGGEGGRRAIRGRRSSSSSYLFIKRDVV